MVLPLLKRWFNKAFNLSSTKSHSKGSIPLDDYDASKQTTGSGKMRSRKKSGFRHPLSIPMDTMATAWASDEAINKDKEDVQKITATTTSASGKGSSEGEHCGKGRPFSSERGSRSGNTDGNGTDRMTDLGNGWGGIAITKTREYKVTQE